MLVMQNNLPAAINAAVARCLRAAGKRRYRLPADFEVYPVLKINAAGRCTGISFWLARLGEHVGRGSTPLWAVMALCPNSSAT